MYDFNKKILQINDKVITTITTSKSKVNTSFALGVVIGFTPKMIKIKIFKRPDFITPDIIIKNPMSVAKYDWEIEG